MIIKPDPIQDEVIELDDITDEINALVDELPDTVESIEVSEPIEDEDVEIEDTGEDWTTDTPITIGWAEQLKALDITEDIYDRAGMTMVLLGDSARGMKEHDNPFHYTSDLHVALRVNDFVGFNESVVRSYMPSGAKFKKDSITFTTLEGVNVTISIVDQVKYPFFSFPDKKLYVNRDVALPNPYNEYISVMVKDGD
jgi:hypothetical protein